MRFSLFFIVGFTAGIGAATPVNLYKSNTIEHLPREVIEGRCYAGARSGSGNGICYENYEARSGWTGNCDPAPYAVRIDDLPETAAIHSLRYNRYTSSTYLP
ncbi:hypothetical protein M434DRAFT_14115 [Hypoxylon sp. CO27-5]|nr:hypothetical protein M434DRAFT_14115 [Hypoxylon sp. CO27-5]